MNSEDLMKQQFFISIDEAASPHLSKEGYFIEDCSVSTLTTKSHAPSKQTIRRALRDLVMRRSVDSSTIKEIQSTDMSTLFIPQKAPINRLPNELIHIILFYCTKQYKDIFQFATVCKQFRTVADHSVLWLHIPLIFYCNKEVLFCLHGEQLAQQRLKNACQGSMQQYFENYFSNASSNSITLFQPMMTISFHPVCKVMINRQQARRPSFDSYMTPLRPTFVNSLKLLPLGQSQLEMNQALYRSANEVKRWFLDVLIEYRLQWRDWQQRYQSTDRWTQSIQRFFEQYLFLLFQCLVLLWCVCVYCFSNYTSSALTLENHIGFCLVLFILGVYLLMGVGFLSIEILKRRMQRQLLLLLNQAQNQLHQSFALIEMLFINLVILGVFLFIFFLYLKDAAVLPNMTYVDIACLFTAVWLLAGGLYIVAQGLLDTKPLLKTEFLGLYYLLSAFPSSLLLLGLYLDDSEQHYGIDNLGYCLIPLYPLMLLVLIASGFYCCTLFQRVRMMLQSGEGSSSLLILTRPPEVKNDFVPRRLSPWRFYLSHGVVLLGMIILNSSMIALNLLLYHNEAKDRSIGSISINPIMLIVLCVISLKIALAGLYYQSHFLQ